MKEWVQCPDSDHAREGGENHKVTKQEIQKEYESRLKSWQVLIPTLIQCKCAMTSAPLPPLGIATVGGWEGVQTVYSCAGYKLHWL